MSNLLELKNKLEEIKRQRVTVQTKIEMMQQEKVKIESLCKEHNINIDDIPTLLGQIATEIEGLRTKAVTGMEQCKQELYKVEEK